MNTQPRLIIAICFILFLTLFLNLSIDASALSKSKGNVSLCVNKPPEIDLSDCSGMAFLSENYTCQVKVTDPNKDNLTFSDNTSLFNIDNRTGKISFTPNSTKNENILISVNDNIGCSNSINSKNLNLSITEKELFSGGRLNPPSQNESGCHKEWVCGRWGECINGTKTRECFYAGDCEDRGEKPTVSTSCETKEKKLSMTLTKVPDKADFSESFNISVLVQNIGDYTLENVSISIKSREGWSSDTIDLGDMKVGKKETLRLRLDNDICQRSYVTINNESSIRIMAKEKEINKTKEFKIDMKIPRLSVFTDKDEYKEGEVMRTCIFLNNLNKERVKVIEFEFNTLSEERHQIVDFISSLSVEDNKVLAVVKDHIIDDVPMTSNYTTHVTAYAGGKLFSKDYRAGKANTDFKLIYLPEFNIALEKGESFDFDYYDENHSMIVKDFNENKVDVIINSKTQKLSLDVFESAETNINDNKQNDIKITYNGMVDNKANLSLSLLSKPPKKLDKSTRTFELDPGDTVQLEKPQLYSFERNNLAIVLIFLLVSLALIVAYLLNKLWK